MVNGQLLMANYYDYKNRQGQKFSAPVCFYHVLYLTIILR